MGPSPDRNVLRNTDASGSVAGEIWSRADVACPCLMSAGEKLACGEFLRGTQVPIRPTKQIKEELRSVLVRSGSTERPLARDVAWGSSPSMGPDVDPKAPAAWLVAKPHPPAEPWS